MVRTHVQNIKCFYSAADRCLMKRGVSRKMGNWTIRVLADWGLSKICRDAETE